MMATVTPTDTYEGNVSSGMRQIRCNGRRHNGQVCDQLLLIVDATLPADDVATRIEGKCPRCAKVYTLAEYR